MIRTLLRTAAALTAAGAATLAYASLIERRWYALRHLTVPVLRPAASRPLRVLHLSDLHLLPGQDHAVRFVRRCLDLRPDLVVATGDLIGHPLAIDEAVGALALPAGLPGLVVLGSNDLYGPSPKNPFGYFTGPSDLDRHRGRRIETARLLEGLERGGWQLVDNLRMTVQTTAGLIDVAGLSDPHIGHDRPHMIDWAPPVEDVALRLGVVHAPYLRVLDLFAQRDFDLVLTGHTHGGQVRVPGLGALVTNCDLPPSRARGLSPLQPSQDEGDEDGRWLHVSAGLGTSMYAPIRFACRPEASLLDLVPARDPRDPAD